MYLQRATDTAEHMQLRICLQVYKLALRAEGFPFPSGCLVVGNNTMGWF